MVKQTYIDPALSHLAVPQPSSKTLNTQKVELDMRSEDLG